MGTAMKLVAQSPVVLTAPAETVLGAWGSLVDTFGDKEAAMKRVVKAPNLLKSPARTIDAARDELGTLFGEADRHRIVRTNPMVLTARAQTIQLCWNLLLERFGRDVAMTKVHANPELLRGRSKLRKPGIS